MPTQGKPLKLIKLEGFSFYPSIALRLRLSSLIWLSEADLNTGRLFS